MLSGRVIRRKAAAGKPEKRTERRRCTTGYKCRAEIQQDAVSFRYATIRPLLVETEIPQYYVWKERRGEAGKK
jgi:hypothetical protein